LYIALLFVSSFIVSLTATYIVKIAAEKTGFFDLPETALKVHSKPVPYAGTAIWLTTIIVLIALRLMTSFPTGTLHQLRGIVIGGALIFILGVVDDIFDLDYRIKFAGQTAAALVLIHYDIYIKLFPVFSLNLLVSIFWVVLVVNAVNIIDILDGLSCGVSAIAALGFFAITLPTEQLYVNFAAIVLFGTLSGFWLYNKPPAKVYMGDGGSLYTGFLLAALSMGADYSNINIIGLFSPLLILGIPLFDTILVIYFRWKAGRPVFKGSKDHYAIRLAAAGLSRWQIDFISYAISAALALAAFGLTVLPVNYAFFLLAAVGAFAVIGTGVLETINPHAE